MDFTCPECNEVLECQTFSGRGEVVCPHCGAGIDLLVESDDDVLAEPDATDSASTTPPSDSGTKSSWPPLQGTDIGEYVLLEELGRGGMGIVYKARQKQLDRFVAIKVVMGGQAASPEDLEQFIAEAQIAAKVRHPNLVGVHGAGENHGWVYFAMEYIDGTGLDQHMNDQPMAPRKAARLMARVARATAHLHEHDLVHCDLKPANILIDKDNVPYVTDFGLSKNVGEHFDYLSEGTIAGTPPYMSPEQADGRVNDTSFASDVYSIGAILYELLTGVETFSGDTVSEIIDHVVGRTPVPPRKIQPGIPRGLEAICLKCLEKSPGDRYATATALADDLDRFLSDEPLEAHNPTPWRRFTRWVLREPALAGRVIAMAVLFGIEVVWYHALGISGLRFHRAVISLVPAWALVSYLFQRLQRIRSRKYVARLSWAAADCVFLTAILYFSAESVCSPAVICYPLLIAGAGLWHHVSLVRVSTLMVMASYGLLWQVTLRLRPDVIGPYDRHVVFLAGLAILGFMVNRLVRHIQILSRRLTRR